MDYIDLFEKQAADEGIDLDMLDDYELAELYNHFVDDVAQSDDDFYSDDEDDFYYDDEEEAYEKLAEAEILGEVMADAYLDKIAEDKADKKRNILRRMGSRIDKGVRGLGQGTMSTSKQLKLLDKGEKKLKRAARLRGYGALAGGAALAGGGAYALSKRRAEKQAAAESDKKPGFMKRVKNRSNSMAGGFGEMFMTKKQQAKLMEKDPTGKKLRAALRRRGYAGAAAGLGAAGYAGYRMSKKASLIEELALEKAASYVDGDWEYNEIDDISDELALEILESEGWL